MPKTKYKVKGMSCAACVARVEKAVSAIDGVENCEVNLLLGSMTVDGTADASTVCDAVKLAGYSANAEDASGGAAKERANEEVSNKSERKETLVRLISSSALLLVLMYVSMGHLMLSLPLPAFLSGNAVSIGLTELLLSGAIMVINKRFFVNGARGIVHLAPNMDTLVALGSAVSYAHSVVLLYLISADVKVGNFASAHERLHGLYFESAAMILVLITVGKLLESIAKGRTTSAIKALMDLSPKVATVIKDGREVTVPASDIRVGDIFIVKRGENIAADGEVIEGEISVDESALTGESMPKDIRVGSTALAATTVSSGYAKIRALKTGEESAISEVIKMVKEASGSKAPIAKAADKVAGIFVPAVLLVSIVTLGVWLAVGAEVGFALARAVTVLVISCPCALGLATPVAIMVGSGVGARRGILFKNARALEAAARIKVVAFDKTGTVTEGRAEVSDIVGVSVSEDELMRLAIAIEEKSEHPLARAIVRYKENIDTVALPDVNDFTAHVGGVSAEISGNVIFGGNRRFIEETTQNMLDEKTAVRLDELSSQGKTALIFSTESKILGIVVVADKIKADAESAVRELNSMGIKTVMLTGDNKITAKYVAERVGFETVISEVLPADKARVLDELSEKYGSAAMVGDGINDSVALTKADVGIAVGRGADVAIDSADVVLTRGAISDVASAIKLSRRVLLNIWENLFWAFIYNIIGIPLAAGLFIAPFGWELDPMFGAAAMSISSFIVVVNALRLNLYNPSKIKSINNDMQTNIDKKDEITKMNTITIKIEGMMCPHCSGRVKAALEASELVSSADVSHERGDAVISLSANAANGARDVLAAIITDAGYKVVD